MRSACYSAWSRGRGNHRKGGGSIARGRVSCGSPQSVQANLKKGSSRLRAGGQGVTSCGLQPPTPLAPPCPGGMRATTVGRGHSAACGRRSLPPTPGACAPAPGHAACVWERLSRNVIPSAGPQDPQPRNLPRCCPRLRAGMLAPIGRKPRPLAACPDRARAKAKGEPLATSCLTSRRGKHLRWIFAAQPESIKFR